MESRAQRTCLYLSFYRHTHTQMRYAQIYHGISSCYTDDTHTHTHNYRQSERKSHTNTSNKAPHIDPSTLAKLDMTSLTASLCVAKRLSCRLASRCVRVCVCVSKGFGHSTAGQKLHRVAYTQEWPHPHPSPYYVITINMLVKVAVVEVEVAAACEILLQRAVAGILAQKAGWLAAIIEASINDGIIIVIIFLRSHKIYQLPVRSWLGLVEILVLNTH